MAEETTVQHVYYIELNRDMVLLRSAGRGGRANIHRYTGGRGIVYTRIRKTDLANLSRSSPCREADFRL